MIAGDRALAGAGGDDRRVEQFGQFGQHAVRAARIAPPPA